jgi:hypothetical protein
MPESLVRTLYPRRVLESDPQLATVTVTVTVLKRPQVPSHV